MFIPEVPEGTDPIILSNLLKTPIEFSLSDLCQIFNLPNGSDHVYLTSFDHLPAYSKTEPEVYSLIVVKSRKPKIATGLKPGFEVIFQMVYWEFRSSRWS